MVGALWATWAGCLWVTPAEHRRNQQDLLAPPAEADTDVDLDTDLDIDVDTDVDSATVGCDDDGFEPNDVPAEASPIEAGRTNAVLCPGDADVYQVEVGPTDVLEVALDGRGGTSCDALTAAMSLSDAGGQFPASFLEGRCGTLRTGWGPGPWHVTVSDAPTAAEQAYRLEVALVPCQDTDDDGYLSQGCGGPDCSDLDDTAHPGALDPQDGADQDCDGGDDLAPLGCEILTGTTLAFGMLPCGDLDAGAVWDGWTIPVPAVGSTVSVAASNDAKGADLVALLVDADGTSHRGLAPDRSELDDEEPCLTPPWSGQGCPAGCVAAALDGDATLWIAQHPGTGCQAEAGYQLLVHVDGLPVKPVQAADDVVLGFP